MNINLLDLPTEFTSERLLMRRYHIDDIPMYYQMSRSNAEHLYEFLTSFLIDVHGKEDIKTWFDRQNTEWSARTLFVFGAWDKALEVRDSSRQIRLILGFERFQRESESTHRPTASTSHRWVAVSCRKIEASHVYLEGQCR
jgi:hypothetical protein